MSDTPAAARRLDLVQHDWSMLGRFGGLVIWIALGWRGLKVAALFTGVGGVAAFALSWAVEWVISTALENVLGALGARFKTEGVPEIHEGSPNVFVNGLEAARGGSAGDKLNCLAHGSVKIAQGSQWVYVNQKPASRIDDRTECSGGGVLATNPGLPPINVFFGGPATQYDNTYWFHDIVKYADVAAKVGNAFREGFSEAAGQSMRDRLMNALLRRGADGAVEGALPEASRAGSDFIADTLWKSQSAPHSFPTGSPQ